MVPTDLYSYRIMFILLAFYFPRKKPLKEKYSQIGKDKRKNELVHLHLETFRFDDETY